MLIRLASLDDAEQIAVVHVESWRTTYSGILPDGFLGSLSVEKRANSWCWTFNNLNEYEVLFVAVNDQGRVVGFSNGGKNRNSEFPHRGELYAIYLLKEYQGLGIGKRLFAAVTESLKLSGCTSMMLWVLDGNPTLAFYESQGGRVIGQKNIAIGGQELAELAVGWDFI